MGKSEIAKEESAGIYFDRVFFGGSEKGDEKHEAFLRAVENGYNLVIIRERITSRRERKEAQVTRLIGAGGES